MKALTVFLVEDNSTIRSQLVPALQELANAEILASAESEDEAVGWLAHHKGQWVLAVVDLFLKQGTGLGVVRWTNGRAEGQKVAVLTNYASELMRTRCLEEGADAVFDKSTELEEFFEFCRQLDRSGGH